MLNNLTNYPDLIRLKAIVDVPQDTDLITLGVRNPNYDGNYRPALNTYRDFADSILAQVPVPPTALLGVHSLIPLQSGDWTSNLIGVALTGGGNISNYQGRIICYPYKPNQTFTISSINVSVTSAYTAGTTIRLAIYSDLNGKPNSLLMNTTDLTTTLGVKTYNTTFTFTQGVTYWLAYQSSNANNTGALSSVAAANCVYIKNNGSVGTADTKYFYESPYVNGVPTSISGLTLAGTDSQPNPAFFLVKA
jgi:hypothetical protein